MRAQPRAQHIADRGQIGAHRHQQHIEAEGHGKAESGGLAALRGAPVDPHAQARRVGGQFLERGGQGGTQGVHLAHRFNPTG
jgi:hypothetical protein